jgi:uridylate kinase
VQPVYRRALLKLSGEALEGSQGHGIDPATLDAVADQLVDVCSLGVQLAVVIGGGNIFRGLAGAASGMERSRADTMGMLATAVNCLAMEDALLRKGQSCRVLTALPVGAAASPFSRREALERLEAGEVVLLAGGTGNPYFTTDTAAALRALEVGADALLKATRVDGVYDKDPEQHADARRFPQISYNEVLQRRLRVMDLTAVTLCRDNGLPLVVFDLTRPGNIRRVIEGQDVGTRVVASRAAAAGPMLERHER